MTLSTSIRSIICIVECDTDVSNLLLCVVRENKHSHYSYEFTILGVHSQVFLRSPTAWNCFSNMKRCEATNDNSAQCPKFLG